MKTQIKLVQSYYFYLTKFPLHIVPWKDEIIFQIFVHDTLKRNPNMYLIVFYYQSWPGRDLI